MKHTISLFALILLTSAQIFSQAVPSPQELPNVTAHSPDVASLGRYGDHPVDMSTGVPNINIPLYTVQSGQLQLPISLSYHAGGIKVDQESSFVGLGWSLNAGGVITRVIQDKMDEENGTGFLYRGNILPDYNPIDGEFPAGLVGNDDPQGMLNDVPLNGPLQMHFNSYDKEPDIYNVQTATGISAQFALNNDLEYASLEYAPLKYDVDLTNESIVVTDQNGNTYRFGRDLENNEAHETSHVTTSTFDVDSGSYPLPNLQPYYDSSWHLTEIISGTTKDTISLKYKSCLYSNTKGTGHSRYILTDGTSGYSDAAGNDLNGLMRSTMTTTIGNTRVIDSILFKNGYIKFGTATDRLDVNTTNVPRITGFTVFDNDDNQVRRVELDNNGHFIRGGGTRVSNGLSVPSGDRARKSLKLNGVNFYGSDDALVEEYSFGYDNTQLPAINTTAQDHWGYYNGAGNSNLIAESFHILYATGHPGYFGNDRDSNFNYMKASTLNKITFPTGGYTEFEYEPHYYLEEHQENGQTLATKTLNLAACNRLSSCPTEFMDGIPSNNTLEFDVTEDVVNNGPADDGQLVIFFSDYDLNSGLPMAFRMTDLDTGSVVHYFEHVFADSGDYKVVTQGINLVEGHSYRLEAMTNGVTGSNMSICDSPWIEVTLSYDHYVTAQPSQIVPIQAGGLRIKTITNHDVNGTLLTKKEYTYGQEAYGPNGVGAGTLISNPDSNFYYLPMLFYTTMGDGITTFPYAELRDALWFTSSSQVELGTNNGSPVDYNMVTEHTTSITNGNLTAGKTEHYYAPSGRQIDKSYATKNRPYNRFIFPRWQGSTLEKKLDYRQKADLSYELVRSEEHTYSDFPEQRIKTLKILEREPKLYNVTDGINYWNSQNRFYYYNFYVSTGKRNLTGTTVKDYENGVETVSRTTSYTYGNQNHLQVTHSSMVTSDGRIITTETWYPDDVTSTTALGYDNLGTGEYNMVDRFKGDDLHRIAQPVQVETIVKEGSVVISKNVQRTNYDNWANGNLLPKELVSLKGSHNATTNPMEERITYHGYNNNGNPTEVSHANGPHIYYVWGYSGQYPIAKIENLEASQITTGLQNLIDAAITASDADDDRTHGANGSEGMLRTALKNIRDHSTLSNSLMTSYTFDPLVGVTSITDPSGQTVYYKYDNFNRLKEIRDRDNNLVTDHEYHYKGQ